MKKITILISFLSVFSAYAQPNCEAFKYAGDTLKYRACLASKAASYHYQFSRKYQEAMDRALEIDSTFAYAYRSKSTAYLKSGDFLTWMDLMNKAVKYDTLSHLDYRGWCRYQFFNDYEGAIKDIELLDELVDYDIGNSVNGDYHLHIARALCYKALGQKKKAIKIIEKQLSDPEYYVGAYDYLHLGVLYLETGKTKAAVKALKSQQENNDLAENRYYIAMAYKKLGNNEAYQSNMEVAREKYEGQMRMNDGYVEMMDEVYLADIEAELNN